MDGFSPVHFALTQWLATKGNILYDDAREYLRIAKEMIDKMGYHRRDKEVEELEKKLAN